MYELIDELIEAILNTNEFKNYQQAQKQLFENQTVVLLSRYQSLMEDYLKIKDYPMNIGQDDLKEKIHEIRREMSCHPGIQLYYQSYYQLNDLLEEVTQIVFQGISKDLKMERFQL